MLLPPVLFQGWPAREGLLAGPTFQPWVLLTGMSPETCEVGAQQATAGAVQGPLSGLCRRARGRV